jgi:branched-chain amino acid aminotransferase
MTASPATALETTYWYDGDLVPASAIAIDPFAHALHYGSGVFEGIRSYETSSGPGIFRLRDHIARLLASAAAYAIDIPFDLDELCDATVAAVRASGAASTYIRPLLFFGEGRFALAPKHQRNATHAMIAVRPFSGSVAPGGEAGCRCTISPVMKTPSRALPSTVKANGHYTNSILAVHDAMDRGFDEALLLNEHGRVAEGSGENVFVVRDGRLRTNGTDEDVLDGITRRTVIDLAMDAGMAVEIGPITVDALRAADEVFLTGTAAELVPVACVDEHVYGTQRPVTATLQAAYRRVTTGASELHRDWVTPVM